MADFNLTPTRLAALRDVAAHTDRGRLYIWAPKTMQKFAKSGLVAFRENASETGYVITGKGRAALAKARGQA